MKQQGFIFHGISGSGKGTQVSLLKDYLSKNDPKRGMFLMEAGKGFREFMSHPSYMAEQAAEITKAGGFQPAFISLWNTVNQFIEGYNGTDHVVIDGTPRQVDEPPIMHKLWNFINIDKVDVVLLDVDENTIYDRLIARGRHDDTPETIKERIVNYKIHVIPVIEWYKQHDEYDVHIVDGNRPPEEVHKDVITRVFAE